MRKPIENERKSIIKTIQLRPSTYKAALRRAKARNARSFQAYLEQLILEDAAK